MGHLFLPGQRGPKGPTGTTGGKPEIRLTQGVAQTFPANVYTSIAWDTEILKDGLTHSTVVNPHIVTVVESGMYAITFGASFTLDGGAPEWVIALVLAGDATFRMYRPPFNMAAVEWSGVVRLAEGDDISVQVNPANNNEPITMQLDSTGVYLLIHRLTL